MFPSYPVHEIFLHPARARSELWRLGLGLLVGLLIFAGLQWALIAGMIALLPPDLLMQVQTDMAFGNTPMGAVMMLASFGLMIIALAAAVDQVHKRRLVTLIGPWMLARPQFLRVVLALAALNLAIWVLPPSEMLAPLEVNLPLGTWLAYLPLALPALLIQVSAEEMLFRGYLQQQLAVRFRNPVVWMVVPSVAFGVLHYRPDMPETTWLLIGWAVLFGILAADLTARAGSLGPAIALHLATNAAAILFVSSDSMLSGLALYRMDVSMEDPAALWPFLLIDLGVMLTSWLAARLAIRC